MIPCRSNRMKHVLGFLILWLAVVMLGGCATITKPFKSSEHIDMEPFAENTINLLADIKHGLDSQMMVYLREYYNSPPINEYRDSWGVYRPVLRGVAAYSLAVVTLSKSNMTDLQRSQKLAEFLDGFLRPKIESGGAAAIVSLSELDTMLADIRVQKNYLDGLRAAQPLVDAIERFSHAYLDGMKDQLMKTRAALDQLVWEDHRASLKFHDLLIDRQNANFELLTLLTDYLQGYDDEGLAKILASDPQSRQSLPANREPTNDELLALQERLLYRIERIGEMKLQVAPDLELYRAKVWELDELARNASDNLTKTRVTVIIWSRAHRGLAAGVSDPAQFDIMGVAKRALNAAIPLP